jgi:hypothetical protein
MKKIVLTGLVVFAIHTFSAQTNTPTGNQNNQGNKSYQNNQNNQNGNYQNGQTGNNQNGQMGTNQNNQIKVPSQVMDKFNSDYPNMDVTWGKDGDNYTATYKDQSTQGGRMLTYDKNGTLMYTDSEMNGSGYPSGIDDYYSKNYPNDKYTIWQSDNGKGDMTYYSKGKNGKTNWFDKDGKYSSKRPGDNMQNTKTNKGSYKKDKNKDNNNSKGTK